MSNLVLKLPACTIVLKPDLADRLGDSGLKLSRVEKKHDKKKLGVTQLTGGLTRRPG